MDRYPTALPIAATVLAIALFSVMDALMKRAGMAGGVYSAMLVRSLLAGAIISVIWRLRGGRVPGAAVLRLHALRGVVGAAMATTFFYGLVRTPMAPGMALSFIAPLIALYLAAVTLGEQIQRKAIAASLLGFAGVALIAAERLGGAGMEGEAGRGIAAILLSAMLYAWNLVLQRKQAQLASPAEVAVFQNLFVALSLLPFFPWLWAAPQGGEWGDIAGSGLLATTSLMLLAWAYARAEAQALVPLEYTAFAWAALMGWLWFAESLSPVTIGGVALIVAGCWIGTRQAEPIVAG
ncbi:MAG: DMT family transporter [Novosphingobium sp.]